MTARTSSAAMIGMGEWLLIVDMFMRMIVCMIVCECLLAFLSVYVCIQSINYNLNVNKVK